MAPDTPEREPEMQDTPPCHSPLEELRCLIEASALRF